MYIDIAIMFLLLLMAMFSYRLSSIFQISNLGYYLIYFYSGYFFNRYYESIIKYIRNPICIIAMLVITVVAVNCSQIVIKMLKALTGSLLFIGITSYIDKSFMTKKDVALMSRDGFGIYLFHPMIIYVLYYYLGNMNVNPFVLCFGITIVSYLLSAVFSEILRKLHMGFAMGE